MKKNKIIVFDVDHTLIRGNLTVFLLRFLIKTQPSILKKISFLKKCLPLLLRGAFLHIWQLPYLSKKILRKDGFYKSNYILFCLIKMFYQSIFNKLKAFNLLEKKLQEAANQFFSEEFFEKYAYKKGIEKIKHHLCNQNNVVVLLSGGLQEPLNIFFTSLCKKFSEENIDWKNRFFVQGTVLKINTKNVNPCIGHEKNNFLKKLLNENGYKDYEIEFIYSDNKLMTDLPLFIESKRGGAVICEKTTLYQFLPEKLTETFIFLPAWNKIN